MSAEQHPERRPRRKPRTELSQLSFVLNPEDAAKVLLLRRFAADVAALYEAHDLQQPYDPLTVRTPDEAYALLRGEMEDLEQEQMRVINFDSRQHVLSTSLIYQGNINTILVRMAELFKPAVRENAHAILVAHNHPSGDPSPSPEDVSITRNLVEAGKILEIDVLDHLVIGKWRYVSLKERGLGFEK